MDINDRIKKIYIPMTETAFYILFCLKKPNHGYGISIKVREMTNNEIVIGNGTMYGTLSKMEKDGLIRFLYEVEKRKIYGITSLGEEILNMELARIEKLYKNSRKDI